MLYLDNIKMLMKTGTLQSDSLRLRQLNIMCVCLLALIASANTITINEIGKNILEKNGMVRKSAKPPTGRRLLQTGGLNTATFTFTGSVVEWQVPNNVYRLNVKMWGAGGGGGSFNSVGYFGSRGGAGGYSQGIIPVTPGSYLYIAVGGGGSGGKMAPQLGGFPNGGGHSRAGSTNGMGGGRSQISVFNTKQTNTADALRVVENIRMIAGGGGGGSVWTTDGFVPVIPAAQGRSGGGLEGNYFFPYNRGGTQELDLLCPNISACSGVISGGFLRGADSPSNFAVNAFNFAPGGDGYYGGSSGMFQTVNGVQNQSVNSGGGGGSGYIHPTVTNGVTFAGNDTSGLPYNATDPANGVLYGLAGNPFNSHYTCGDLDTRCHGKNGFIHVSYNITCNAGMYSNGTLCIQCALNFYCPLDTTTPVACPAPGSYNNSLITPSSVFLSNNAANGWKSAGFPYTWIIPFDSSQLVSLGYGGTWSGLGNVYYVQGAWIKWITGSITDQVAVVLINEKPGCSRSRTLSYIQTPIEVIPNVAYEVIVDLGIRNDDLYPPSHFASKKMSAFTIEWSSDNGASWSTVYHIASVPWAVVFTATSSSIISSSSSGIIRLIANSANIDTDYFCAFGHLMILKVSVKVKPGCSTCPVNHYCTGGQKLNCPASAVSLAGSKDQSDCKCSGGNFLSAMGCICPAGMLCGSSGDPQQCVLGSYCPEDSISEQPCQAGYYCATPATQVQCPATTYCPQNSTTPTNCPGNWTTSPGSTKRADCGTCLPGYILRNATIASLLRTCANSLCPVSASSTHPSLNPPPTDYFPIFAFDNNMNLYWVSHLGVNGFHWLRMDLQTARPLTGLSVRPPDGFANRLRRFRVYVGDDQSFPGNNSLVYTSSSESVVSENAVFSAYGRYLFINYNKPNTQYKHCCYHNTTITLLQTRLLLP